MAWPDDIEVADADGVKRAVPVPKGAIGATNDAAATTDAGNFSLIALTKRLLQRFTTALATWGAPDDAAWESGNGSHTALLKTIAGGVGSDEPIPYEPVPEQDPIYDYANGDKKAIATLAALITPPAGCRFLRIVSDADVYIGPPGGDATSDGKSLLIKANLPEVIPVTPSQAIKAVAVTGTANVFVMPMKVR